VNKPDEVAFATDDVLVLLSGAGAGKTTALMRELEELLKVYRPDEIAFVTFTRKGVANGIERALRASPQLSVDDLVYFKTLHALCFRELGLKRGAIINRYDLADFNRLLGFKLHLNPAFGNQTGDDQLLSRYDALRSGGKKGVYAEGVVDEARYKRLTKAYEAFKRTRGLVDFHDCLLRFLDRGKPVAVKAALIDEAQDLTLLQWEVCRTAFSQCEKVRIAGDDYQSLFTYSGASPRTLVSLASRYPSEKLESSHRLPKEVYRFARGVTALIGDKIEKDFKPTKSVDGFVEELSDRTALTRKILKDFEERGPQPGRWYLLFRNNYFMSDMAPILEQHMVPYHTSKGFCLNDRLLAKVKRYYNFQKKGFGTKEAFERFCEEHNIKDINADFTESDLIPSERRYVYDSYVRRHGVEALERMSRGEPFLLLSTTHKVKGGEADFVAVFLDCTKKVMENALRNLDEELRVLYVACTRARVGLYLCQSAGTSLHNLSRVVDAVREAML
jgi:superfamily I DNA/RNA helicase